jgi:hypothetical protein
VAAPGIGWWVFPQAKKKKISKHTKTGANAYNFLKA